MRKKSYDLFLCLIEFVIYMWSSVKIINDIKVYDNRNKQNIHSLSCFSAYWIEFLRNGQLVLVFNFVSDSKQSKPVHEEEKFVQSLIEISNLYPRLSKDFPCQYIWLECFEPWEYITFIIPLSFFLFVVHRRCQQNIQAFGACCWCSSSKSFMLHTCIQTYMTCICIWYVVSCVSDKCTRLLYYSTLFAR